MGRPGSWSPGVGFCLRLLLLLSLALPTAGLLLWGRAENRRRMESLCGGWEAVPPRGYLVIARTGGHHTLTFYSPKGIRRGSERLRGGRCPHYGRGKGRTELWLSEDGRTLLLVPGNTYRRIGPPQKKKSNLKHSTTMRTKNVGNEEIGGIVARRKREHAENGRLLAALERMQAEALLSVFCGSWIATEGTTSLLVRREAEGYGLLLCDNTHCYKSIVADLRAEGRGRRLLLDDGGEATLTPDGLLHCGRYGTFRTEEELLRQELQYEMDFALRSPSDEEPEA